MSAMDQARHEGLCLRYPENLGLHPSITYEMAVSMLLKAVNVSQQLPFHWSWIDRPNEGQVFLIFIPGQGSFPNDGIRYQEAENRYSIPAGANKELEITESKYGFIPSHPSSPSPSPDTSAWRVRRRYRLIKGGHPQLVLVHYGRGVGAPIIPTLATQPIRSYPLRQISEPAIYVAGDKAGQKVYAGGIGASPGGMSGIPGGGMGGGGMGGGAIGAHNLLAQQNREMEALERRGGGMGGMGGMGSPMGGSGMGMGGGMGGGMTSAMGGMGGGMGRDRSGSRGMAGMQGMSPGAAMSTAAGQMGGAGHRQQQAQAQQAGPPRVDDDDSADEAEQISTRSLALTRYKRNHDLMNEVFMYAAFGDPVKRAEAQSKTVKREEEKIETPFSIFDTGEMDVKITKLDEEIAQLKARAAGRKQLRRDVDDVTMEGLTA